MIGTKIGGFARALLLFSCFTSTGLHACCETYEHVPMHCDTDFTWVDAGYVTLDGEVMVGEVVYEGEILDGDTTEVVYEAEVSGEAIVMEDEVGADGYETVIDSGATDIGFETIVDDGGYVLVDEGKIVVFDDAFTYEGAPQTTHEAPVVEETGYCDGCYADPILDDTTLVSDDVIWVDSEPTPAFSVVDPVVDDVATEEASTQDSGESTDSIFDTEDDANSDADSSNEVDGDELNDA